MTNNRMPGAGRDQYGQANGRTFLEGGVFNKVEFLGTEAMGGGHGDMRNAGGMHAKMMRNAQVRKPTQGAAMDFAAFVKQDADAVKRDKEMAKRPDAKKVKQMVGPGKLAPMIDTGGGRKARMVVGVRIRPLFPKEQRKGCTNVLEVRQGQEVFAYDPDDKMGGLDYLRLNVTKDKAYTYDHAFGPEISTGDVYQKTMVGVVSAVMQGFHGSCFAYGATGSGKTFTMAGSQDMPGIMPRAINDMFKIAKKDDDKKWSFTMTYVEIYNERVKDLLNPSSQELDVRECPKKGNVVAGAVEVNVSSLQEIMELMSKGTLYRTTEATNCNEVSSRSHAVMQIAVTAVDKYKDARRAKKQYSRLSMIDLAGSERAYKTDNTGQRLREGRNINRSLLSLANCINALADKSKKISHVPYRDSKLTRLLRDSLSGTSVSAMICAVSPASDQFEETLNTLKYANRAKEMSPPGDPTKNVKDHNPVAEQVEVLKELKESLMPMMKQMATPKVAGGNGKKADKQKNARDERAARRNADSRSNSRSNSRAGTPAASDDEDDDFDVTDNQHNTSAADAKRARRLSAAAEDAVAGVGALSNDASNMAEVRKVLEDVCEAEPEAKANPAVQAAYQALDNMEAEEVEAITAEGALLFKEQQTLVREVAKSKHALKLAAVRLAWYDAAPDMVADDEAVPGEENVGGGKEALDELIERQEQEEANLARLRQELADNKKAVASLQGDVGQRVVSAKRLETLRLNLKQGQAAADALRFKQQARSVGGIMQEVLSAWESAIPEGLQSLLLEVFDLEGSAKNNASIDTQRRNALETARNADGNVAGTPATGLKKATKARAASKKASQAANAPADRDVGPVGEEEESEYDSEDDEDDALDGAKKGTPFRTLGSLAKQAAQGANADDDDDDDDEEDDEEEVPKAVVREATEELKNARTKRMSVMDFVEKATTPKPPKKTRSAAAGAKDKKEPKEAPKQLPQADSDRSYDEVTESASMPSSPRGKRAARNNDKRAPLSDRSDINSGRKEKGTGKSNSARGRDGSKPKTRPVARETRAKAAKA